jgi:hypothetical protein
MKNFFELFGFLSTACISAAIIFIFMGKKDGLKGDTKDALTSEYSVVADAPNAPRSVTKGTRDNYASDSGSARRAKGNREESVSASSNVAADERLKSLYNDGDFVAETTKKWKSAVADVADEYNVKPQVLLANVIVQSYLGSYSKSQLNQDAAQHAGDRVMPASNAAKRYKFSWSIQKVMDQHNLSRFFAAEIPTASASSSRMVSAKNSSAKGAVAAKPSASKVTATAKNDPMEEGFKNMVAKEYGFGSWTGCTTPRRP